MPKFARLCAACLLLAGCFGAVEDNTEITVSRALAFEEVGRGRQALVDTTERAILDAATWEAYGDSLRALIEFSSVDFEAEMVILAALPVPVGGYDLRFEVIDETPGGLLARYRLFAPGNDCRVTVGKGVVFQAVRLARTDLPVTFLSEVEYLRCTEPG